MKYEIRAVIRFLHLRKEVNKNIFTIINETYGENTVSLSTVKRWTKLFRDGKHDLDDEERCGRPRKDKFIGKISRLIDENPSLSCKKISSKLNISRETVKKILNKDLDLVKMNLRWIPYYLDDSRKKIRVEKSKELLYCLENTPRKERCNILTADETWVYYDNPILSIWQRSGMPRPNHQKKNIASKKLMMTVIWSISGIHLIDFLPRDEKFNKDYFASFFFKLNFSNNVDNVMSNLESIFREKRPKRICKGLKLHLDNAKPHLIQEKFDSLGILRLPHPPYSPDLAPSDFFLFGLLKNKLEGLSFDNDDELQEKTIKILKEIPREIFEESFEEWISRLKKCIELDGEYL